MLLRNYLSSFSIIIGLSPLIFLCLSSPALAQPIEVSILIDDEFKAMGEEIKWLSKGGPGMLRSALFDSISAELVDLTCIVKGEARTRDLLQPEPKGSMDESAFFKLKEIEVDYVISVTYIDLPQEHYRLDARMEKVEKAGAFISENHTFNLAQVYEGRPFRPLADKLINALYKHKKISEDKPYMMLLTGFAVVCPNEWRDHPIAERVQNRIRNLLNKHRFKKTELIDPIDKKNTKGKSGKKLSDMYPRYDLFIIGKIIIYVQPDKVIVETYISIVDKDDKVSAASSIDFNAFSMAELMDSLKTLITALKGELEDRIK